MGVKTVHFWLVFPLLYYKRASLIVVVGRAWREGVSGGGGSGGLFRTSGSIIKTDCETKT